MAAEEVDVLIVGAGLSGIGAGYYLQMNCPQKSYAILEARDVIGGTWDVFRYPGVRSDSDMYTLGFSFHPWHDPKAIADGPSILSYVQETAQAYGIDKKIRLNHRVRRAEWSSEDERWTVEAVCAAGEVVRLGCRFLYLCSGSYDYEHGYSPAWPGVEQFAGCIVHPQQWPEKLDYAGKQVVLIGSGATAVTLVPAIAKQAAHVAMLLRAPTYVVSLPSEDSAASWLRATLRAHRQLRRGLAVRCPVLVLHSSASVRGTEWNPDFQSADGVLNAEHIRQGSRCLGPEVTVCEVKDGMQDLVRSRADVRAQVFEEMFGWPEKL